MLDEVVEAFKDNVEKQPKNGIVFLDCTLGGGGHAYKLAQWIGNNGLYIGIDQDREAIENASKRLNTLSKDEKPKLELVQDNFSNIDDVLSSIPVDGVDGVLMDLGVSSYQIDNTDRGFSFKQNCILDMRMNPQSEISALDVVNTYSEYDLSNLIYKYSDEIYAKKIANNIVKSRKTQAIKTSDHLVEIIKNSIPARARRHGGHPAKRTFQALRIEVNDEIKKLNDALDQIIKWLNTGGVIAIISYHSLEDRIVKSKFKSCVNRCTCPKTLPKCVCGRKPIFNIITNKPIMAKDSEVKENRRSRSAKLRVAKRI